MNKTMSILYDAYNGLPREALSVELGSAWENLENHLNKVVTDNKDRSKISDCVTSVLAVVDENAFEAGFRMAINLMAEGGK